MILTNPPFGGMEEDGIENNCPIDFRTRETADLFLVLIVELLKPGGRAAVVLPKGVFAPYTSIQTNVLFFALGDS